MEQEQWSDSRDGHFPGRSMGPPDLHSIHRRQQVIPLKIDATNISFC